jgi:uncharacterized membrane protein
MGILILFFLLIITPVYPAQPYTDLEPHEINVDIMQGQTIFKKITLTNTGDQTLSGDIEVLNVECANECPWAKLSIDRLELNPNGSIEVELEIRSDLQNELGETTLSIHYYHENDPGNETTIKIDINVQFNYFIYIGVPITILIIVISVLVYWKKIRKNKMI